MPRIASMCLLTAIFFDVLSVAWAAGPTGPHPVLNAAGHTGRVMRVSFTPDDSRVISISTDKTVRLWDVASGETVSILRPPFGAGNDGELLAGAISHDGKHVAVGGTFPGTSSFFPAIYLVSLDSGRIEQILEGHLNNISTLEFSPNGEQLASGSLDRTVRLWNVKSGDCVRVLERQAAVISKIAYSPDGQSLATGCTNGTAGIWSLASGEKLHDLRAHSAELTALAWSPDGKALATACRDRFFCVWNADGSLRRKSPDFPQAVGALVFTPDSRRLLIGSSPAGQQRVDPCLWVDLETFDMRPTFSHHLQTMSQAAFSKDGLLAATTTARGGDFYLWQTKDGSIVHRLFGAGKDGLATAWSRDGTAVAWGTRFASDPTKQWNPLERAFSLANLDFTRFDNTYERASGRQGKVSVRISKDARLLEIKRDDKIVSTVDAGGPNLTCACLLDEQHALVGVRSGILSLIDLKTAARVAHYSGHLNPAYSLAASPDRKYFLSTGTDQILNIWSREIRKDIARPYAGIGIAMGVRGNELWIVALAPDGPAARSGQLKVGDTVLAISDKNGQMVELADDLRTSTQLGRGDPGTTVRFKVLPQGAKEPLTVELRRQLVVGAIPTGAPLLSLFFENNEWIAWTPEGYYAASAGGEKLIGWQVNDESNRTATFYPAEQFHDTFYRPDVIKRLLVAGSVEQALVLADAARKRETAATNLSQVLPPQVAITSPAKFTRHLPDASFEVQVTAASVGGRPVISLRLLVDGRPYRGDAGLRTMRDPKPGEVRNSWQVELPAGRHRLAVIAASAVSQTVSDEIDVVIASPAAASVKPAASSLHLVAVGINAYPGRMKLDCAAPDAQAIEQAFRAQSQGLYAVNSTLLVNERATRKGIIDSLDGLAQKAKSGDVAVVFYAGHGDCKIAGQFYLLPVDVNVQTLAETGVSGDELRSRLAKLPCTVLLVMDCCYAGSFDAGQKKRALPNAAGDLVRELVSDEQGLVVMCGASKDQESGEEARLGHGYFTQALIEGLEGKAASRRDGLVYLSGLQNYVEERVRELSDDEQYPTIGKPTLIHSFPLSKPKITLGKP